MSHTNHRRKGDKPRRDGLRYAGSPMGGTGRTSHFADIDISAGWGGDNSQGHKGWGHVKAGAKKFVRSRIRFHEKQVLDRKVKSEGLE